MLQPSPDMGDTCLVEWASGSQGTYETGWGGRFELVHLEMSRTSGAPVVGEDWTGMKARRELLLWDGSELQQPEHLSVSQLVGGTAVERGIHWVYGGAEPGVGSIYAAASARRAQTKRGKPFAFAVFARARTDLLVRALRSSASLAQSQLVAKHSPHYMQTPYMPLARWLPGAVHMMITHPLITHTHMLVATVLMMAASILRTQLPTANTHN